MAQAFVIHYDGVMRVGRPPSLDGRAAERKPVGISAQLREAGGSRMDIDVLDLSRTGFRTACIYNVPVGARVYLTIPSFSAMEAVVAWRDGAGFGCKFAQPLHPAVFDMIARRHPLR
jgi:PilZ domain